MTLDTPGKIPITECSSESKHLQKHDVPVVSSTACQAADYNLLHAYLQRQSTCKMHLKEVKINVCFCKRSSAVLCHCHFTAHSLS